MDVQQEARRRELAMIHLAKKQLGLDEATYRAILMQISGVESAGDLDAKGRQRLILFLKEKGFVSKRGKPHRGQPRDMRQESTGQMLRKIEYLLAELARLEGRYMPWSYALAILKRQYGIERLEWAKPEHLKGVIAALNKSLKGRLAKQAARG